MVPLYFRKCYLSLLFLITSFYILPSIQFVIYQLQIDNEKTDNICYFNNKCSYPLGAVHSFNNLLSNHFLIIAFLPTNSLIIYFIKV